MNYRGSAYTFRREGNTWLPMTKLAPFGLGYAEWFGECVAISDDTLVVGAPRGSDNGSAFVFQREGNAWVEQAVLTPPDPATARHFGHAVAIDGDRIVVGEYGEFGVSGMRGAAHIFDRDGQIWTHRARLSSPTPMTRGLFGWSADVSGDTVVLGELASKSAYVFHEEGGIWVEQAQLHSATPGENVHKTVAIEGDTIVLGHFRDDTFGSSAGSANIFRRTGDTWTLYQQIFGNGSNDRMGVSVAIDAGTIVTTAYGHDGVAYVYVPEPATLSVMTLCGVAVLRRRKRQSKTLSTQTPQEVAVSRRANVILRQGALK